MKVYIYSFSNTVAFKMRAQQSDDDLILIDYLTTFHPRCTFKPRGHSLLSMSSQGPGNDGQPPRQNVALLTAQHTKSDLRILLPNMGYLSAISVYRGKRTA
jgi:hypothetical protein